MPVILTPLRIDRVQRGLFEVFSEATGVDVGWSYSEVPMESLGESFVSLTMVSGPGPFIRKHRRGTTLQPIDVVTLTVGPLIVGKRLALVLNGFNYFEDVSGLDTPTTVRDRLVAQVNDPLSDEPVTAAAVGADELTLTADSVGAIVTLAVYGEITAGAPTLNSGFVHVIEGAQTMLVGVQSYSKQREPRSGAWALIQQCLAALQTEDLVEDLRALGVGIWDHSSPTDLSAIPDAHWETRASFDLTVAARAQWVRPVDVIETVNGTANGQPFAATSP